MAGVVEPMATGLGGDMFALVWSARDTTQPQAQAQPVINMVDPKMNVQATADAARFDHDQLSDTAGLDTGLMDLVEPQLTALGHKVALARGQSGVYQVLLFERDPRLRRAAHAASRNAVLQGRSRTEQRPQPPLRATAERRIPGGLGPPPGRTRRRVVKRSPTA